MKKTPLLLVLVGSLALSPACKKYPPAPSTDASEALMKVFSTEPEGTAQAIHKVRSQVNPGDRVTLRGRVMGNPEPFLADRAIFILGDPEKLTPCNENPDDSCATPWDTCCDSAEDIREGTASIQVVDISEKVLREPIEDINGLTKLSSVIVSGTVAQGANPNLLIVNAEAIKVLK